MGWLMAIFLGLVQGVTEFLPVSSSGHLALIQNIFGVEDHHERHAFFDVMLHMGTLVAVCMVYRSDIVEMCRAVLALFRGGSGREDRPVLPSKTRLAFMLIVALLPLFLVLPFRSAVGALGNQIWFVGLMLLMTGGVLYYSDKLVQGRRTEKNMTLQNALVIGLFQAIAVLPGLSRSGITITAGLMGGLDRAFAVRFSFLLSIPTILGAYIVTLFTSLSEVDWSLLPQYLVGVIVAGITGYFAIHLVRLVVEKGRFGKFAYYCWVVGTIAIIWSIGSAIFS